LEDEMSQNAIEIIMVIAMPATINNLFFIFTRGLISENSLGGEGICYRW
jgi:hypothetical protein